MVVSEINRPDRAARRSVGKSDPTHAEAAARAVLAGVRTAVPKDRTSTRGAQVEALRVLRVARRNAVQARALAMRQLKSVLITAPEELRRRLTPLNDRALLATRPALRPGTAAAAIGQPTAATKVTLQVLARRHATAAGEVAELDVVIEPLVAALNPRLMPPRASGSGSPASCCSPPAATQTESPPRGPSPWSAAPTDPGVLGQDQPPPPQSPAGTARPTPPAIASWSAACARTPAPAPTSSAEPPKGSSKRGIIRCLKRTVAREIYYVLRSTELPTGDLTLVA